MVVGPRVISGACFPRAPQQSVVTWSCGYYEFTRVRSLLTAASFAHRSMCLLSLVLDFTEVLEHLLSSRYYCTVGMDAEVAYRFHRLRTTKPWLSPTRKTNIFWYIDTTQDCLVCSACACRLPAAVVFTRLGLLPHAGISIQRAEQAGSAAPSRECLGPLI